MPRFVVTPQAPSPKHERLVKKLVQEFRTSSTNLQPLILEEQVPSTKSRHVRVIWDAWKDLGDEQRAAVIVDAYTEAEGTEAAQEITLAENLTPQEALALGLLPFKVVPTRKRTDATWRTPKPPLPPRRATRSSVRRPRSCVSRVSRTAGLGHAGFLLLPAHVGMGWAQDGGAALIRLDMSQNKIRIAP